MNPEPEIDDETSKSLADTYHLASKSAYEFILTGKSSPPKFTLSSIESAATHKAKADWFENNLTPKPEKRDSGKIHRALERLWTQATDISDDDALRSFITSTIRDAKERTEAVLSLGPREEGATAHVREHLIGIIDEVSALAAEGNEQAVFSVARIALSAVQSLHMISLHQPDLVRAVAQNWGEWPFTIGPHPDTLRMRKDALTRLNIGKESILNTGSKWSNAYSGGQIFRSVIGQCIERAMQVLQKFRNDGLLNTINTIPDLLGGHKIPEWLLSAVRLPDIETAADADVWFDLLWTTLLIATDQQPELHPMFAGIGKARAEYRARERGIKAKQVKVEEKVAIKARFKNAFKKRFYPKKERVTFCPPKE